jgi:hypothetical protein
MLFKSIFIILDVITTINMKTFRQFVLSFLVLLSGSSFGQAISENLFEEFLFGGANDANVLLGQYMLPGMKGLGYGINSGWYNTAKPHESFGFDITLSYVNAVVPDEDKQFEFISSDYQFTSLGSGASSTLKTIMGDVYSSPNSLEVSPDGQNFFPYNAPDGVSGDIDKITMISGSVPTPIIQVGVGIIKGTEIKIRWLPSIDYGANGTFRFKYFGLGGLHSISQWIPGLKDVPVDISAFVGWTTISAEYDIPENLSIPGSNQRATADINTLTYQLIASAHVSVITGYVGLGFDNFKTNFKMLGTYDISKPGFPQAQLVDPIDLQQDGSAAFRTSFGARLKLSIITLSADYTVREYNTLTMSLGFSVR